MNKNTRGRTVMEKLEVRQLFSLAIPTDLSVSAQFAGAVAGLSEDQAQISWTDTNTTETGYRVEYSPDGVSNWTALPLVPSSDPSEINDIITTTQSLDSGQKYFYRVFAYDGSGDSSPSSIVSPETSIDRSVQLSATASVTGGAHSGGGDED